MRKKFLINVSATRMIVIFSRDVATKNFVSRFWIVI